MTSVGQKIRSSKTFRFVVSESVRLHKELLDPSRPRRETKEFPSWIQLPTRGIRIIGIEAERRLYALAQRKVDDDPNLKGRVAPSKLLMNFKKELGIEFEQPTGRAPADIVAKAIEDVKEAIRGARYYYIPCILPQHSKISSFRIGPVKFWRKEKAVDFLAENIIEPISGDFLKFKEQKKTYNWIAEVQIDDFDESKGRHQARLFARLAIVGVKSCFNEDFSKWLGTDDQLMPTFLDFAIERAGNDDPHVVWRKQFILNGHDEDVEGVFEIGRASWLRLLGSFLDQYVTRGDFGFIGNRIITALLWADTGTSPLDASQRIIAYSNCLESLFVTEEIGKRAQLLKRAAPFLKLSDGDVDWDAKVSEFYSVRSNLVHGIISPTSETLKRHLRLGKQLTDHSLIGMLNFCVWLLNKYPAETTQRHLSPFNGRGSLSKAFEAHFSEFLTEISVD